MVARWETGKTKPTGPWLLKLKRLAQEARLDEHAEALAGAIDRTVQVRPLIELRTEEEVRTVNAILRILRLPKDYPKQLEIVKAAIKEPSRDNDSILRVRQAGIDLNRAIGRLKESGQSAAQIAHILGIKEEEVNVSIGVAQMKKLLGGEEDSK
jgi:hypothetical protein